MAGWQTLSAKPASACRGFECLLLVFEAFVAGPVLAPDALNFLHGLGRCKNRALSVPQAAGDLGLFCFGQPSPDRAFLLLH